MRELETKNFHIWYAMCFWKVKDGHLTILTDCPFPSFWSELPNCEEQICDVCAMNETFSKFILRKRKKRQEWSLIQSLLWAQVSQLIFIYLLRLDIIPYWP